MSRSRDYVNGVPCETAERIARKRKKAVKTFSRRDDDLGVIFRSGTRQTTLRKTEKPDNEV